MVRVEETLKDDDRGGHNDWDMQLALVPRECHSA